MEDKWSQKRDSQKRKRTQKRKERGSGSGRGIITRGGREEELSQEEQEEENQTNCKFAIAFVRTCLSLVDLLKKTAGRRTGAFT